MLIQYTDRESVAREGEGGKESDAVRGGGGVSMKKKMQNEAVDTSMGQKVPNDERKE